MATMAKSERFGSAPLTFEDALRGYIEIYRNELSGNAWHPDAREFNLFLESVVTESHDTPKATFGLQIKREMCNFTGNLHGGCAATIIDDITTLIVLAISRDDFYQQGGVSRNLSTTYFRPIPVDTHVKIVCEVVDAGKRLVKLRAGIYRADTGKLCVHGENEKSNSDQRPKAKV